MLVLSRNKNEKIYIGHHIVLTIVEIRGGTVRIGIDAPSNVTVDREEVRENKIRNGEIKATTSQGRKNVRSGSPIQ